MVTIQSECVLMVVDGKPELLHWNYFLALEADAEKLSRYVEFTEDNFSTYSIELAHLLLAAASEVDVVAKILCKKVAPPIKADSINKYCEILKPVYQNIQRMNILMPRYGLELCPWIDWSDDGVPEWWTAHNKVKHHRHIDYQRGNLKNALDALAGLFVMLLYLYREEAGCGKLFPLPALFMVESEFFRGVDLGSGYMKHIYEIK